MSERWAIEVDGLQKAYGKYVAIRDLDLRVREGEIYGLLGPNGAGKTTTIEILEGYRRRDAGAVSVLGVDPSKADGAWRAKIGIVLQTCQVQPQLTVAELIDLYGGLYPNSRPVEQTLALVGLEEKRNTRASQLSGGQLRRLDVALGIVGNPELLFLDEPTTGFDPAARREAWDVVASLRESGTTIVLTTHYMDEAQALADRLGVLAGGKLVAEGSPAQISAGIAARSRVRFELDAAPTIDLEQLPRLGREAWRLDDLQLSIKTAEPLRLLGLLDEWAREHSAAVRNLEVSNPSLEDAFLEIVAGEDST